MMKAVAAFAHKKATSWVIKLKLLTEAVHVMLAIKKLNSSTFKFHKVVQKQMRSKVIGFIPTSAVQLKTWSWRN